MSSRALGSARVFGLLQRALCAGLMLGTLAACATYRDDLARAQFHYNANKYPEALALLELLELDLDSLSKEERAEYAYYRGMSHFRIGERRHARHWLARANARNSQFNGRLTKDTSKRIEDTLASLNRAVWGERSASDALATKCSQDADCSSGYFCDPPRCKSATKDGKAKTGTKPAEAAAKTGKKPGATSPSPAAAKGTPKSAPAPASKGAKSCTQTLDCPGAQVCKNGTCSDLGG